MEDLLVDAVSHTEVSGSEQAVGSCIAYTTTNLGLVYLARFDARSGPHYVPPEMSVNLEWSWRNGYDAVSICMQEPRHSVPATTLQLPYITQ